MEPGGPSAHRYAVMAYYELRNVGEEPKRLKFIIFSNIEPATSCDIKPATGPNNLFHKRIDTDRDDHCNKDVDFLNLKKHFIKQFPKLIKDKNVDDVFDHFKFYQNKTEADMLGALEALKDDKNLHFYDCFIFIFLTFCSDIGKSQIHSRDTVVPMDKIYEKVNDVPSMNGKPKIFLVQADDLALLQGKFKSKGPDDREPVRQKIPTDSDRLIITSTIPAKGFVAGKDDPSFLIRAFVEAINENRDTQMDFLSLTVEINARVSGMIGNQLQLPIPHTTSTFRKLLKL